MSAVAHGLRATMSLAPVLIATCCMPALAQLTRENDRPIEHRGLADLAGGLVLDATVTVLGREFFTAYADAWRELDTEQRYSITIQEIPTARFGSTLRVQARGRVAYQSLLRPNRQAARELAPVVAAEIFNGLLRTEAEEALFRDPDLGREELP
jgi:curli production assembly/transport component CsgE